MTFPQRAAWPMTVFTLFAIWGLGLAGIIAALEPAEASSPAASSAEADASATVLVSSSRP